MRSSEEFFAVRGLAWGSILSDFNKQVAVSDLDWAEWPG